MRATQIFALVGGLMMLTWGFSITPVRAAAWDGLSYMPSSINDYWTEAGISIPPPANHDAMRELCPAVGWYTDVYSADYRYRSVAVNNWSWERYSGWNNASDYIDEKPPGIYGNETFVPGGSISGTLGIYWGTIYNSTLPNVPITGDHIISVTAIAMFNSARSPYCYFGLSSNGGISYPDQSTGFPTYWTDWPKLLTWNMTGERAWTPADFTDPDIRLQLTMELYPGVHYNLDYLGLVILFEDNTGGSGGSYSMGEIRLDIGGAFGVIGFIGMTICPAYAVMQWRNGGDGRVARLLMSIVAMLVFFTLFLASLGA